MSRVRVVVDGVYQWSDNEPAVGRFHGAAAWGTRNAAVVGTMLPILHGPLPRTAYGQRRIDRDRAAGRKR